MFVHRALGVGIQTRTPPRLRARAGEGGDARRPIRSSHGGVETPRGAIHLDKGEWSEERPILGFAIESSPIDPLAAVSCITWRETVLEKKNIISLMNGTLTIGHLVLQLARLLLQTLLFSFYLCQCALVFGFCLQHVSNPREPTLRCINSTFLRYPRLIILVEYCTHSPTIDNHLLKQ